MGRTQRRTDEKVKKLRDPKPKQRERKQDRRDGKDQCRRYS